MSSDESQPAREELQFDRVDTGAPATDATPTTTAPSVTCAVCNTAVATEYYHVNDKPVCANCREILLAAAKTPRTAGPLVRAGVFGVGAAIAGAAIYYAVIAITNFEIGLVAILIGYMVGYSVRKGAGGRGGRRFQILALILTYWAVGLAYTPLAFKELTQDDKSAAMLADSAKASGIAVDSLPSPTSTPSDPVATRTPSESTDSLNTAPMTGSKLLLGLGLGLVFVFALPIMSIVGSLPGGLLSALIIGIGLHQAWSMTGPPKLTVSGPYKVGTGPTPDAAQPTT